jgi:dephospho-CoA kinase
LTGGIGSGKSTVAELFARRGVPVLDTDLIARDVVEPGQPALEEIVRAFGNQVLDTNGRLDRRALRLRVFEDPLARRRLEAILHPRIRAALEQRLQALAAPYCLIVVPLLIETNFTALIDRVLVVDVDEKHQLARTSERDQIAAAAVQKTIDVQATRAQRLARADDVITNNGNLDDLESAVARLHERYLALATET